MTARRFPEPWTVQGNDSCFWVQDAEGKRFGFTYFDERPGGIATGMPPRLTRDEARRIARNIARLPGLLALKQPRR